MFFLKLGLEEFPGVSSSTIMPPPGTINIPPIQYAEKSPVNLKGLTIIPFRWVLLIDGSHKCVECEGFINSEHFK